MNTLSDVTKYGTYGGEERYLLGFSAENGRERGQLKSAGVDKRIILEWILKKSAGIVWSLLILLSSWAAVSSNGCYGYINWGEVRE